MSQSRITLRHAPDSTGISHPVHLAADGIGANTSWNWAAGIGYIWDRRQWVLTFSGAVLALAAAYSLISPSQYTATATILPAESARKLASLNALPAGLLSMAQAALPAELASGSELYPTILRSESVIRPLLERPFPTSAGDDEPSVTLAKLVEADDPLTGIERVQELLKTSVTRATGACRLSVTLTDPVTAAAVCNAFIGALEERGITLHTAGAGRIRQFVEQRLDEVQGELQKAELELEGFRAQNRNYAYSSSPDLQLADERLAREVTLKSQLYLRLSQEYEVARIEEKRDLADFRVLDTASVPTKASGPHRVRLTLVAGITSFPVSTAMLLLWQFMVQWLASLKSQIVMPGAAAPSRLAGLPHREAGESDA